MSEPISKFQISVVRDVFILADGETENSLSKLLKGFYFLHCRSAEEINLSRKEIYFVIAACDFNNSAGVQTIAEKFTAIESPLVQRVLYVTSPGSLSREQLLFSQEIGCRFVAFGTLRNDDLKNYLKRICIDVHQLGSLENYQEEVELGIRAGDTAMLAQSLEKLRALPEMTEEVLRLLALVSVHLNDTRRAESYLRKLLGINPQNLWAANTLGKIYLKSGRVTQGVETLEKLSRFHELNGERLLTLGDAYVEAGHTEKAEAAYRKGDSLSQGQDVRFADGLAKVKLASGDLEGALSIVGNRGFTENVISFLNLRAIMAIRTGNLEEGIGCYEQALAGSREDFVLKAKLKFNMGLAFVRVGELMRAQSAFEESVRLGGPSFNRASGPLAIVGGVLQRQKKDSSSATSAPMNFDNVEWESLS